MSVLAQGEVKQQPTQTSQLPKSVPATQHDAGRHFCSLCNVCIIPNVCTFSPPRPQNELTPRASCHRPIARSRPRSSQSQPSRNHSADVVAANFPDREMGEKGILRYLGSTNDVPLPPPWMLSGKSRYLSHISQHLEGHVSYDHLIILSDDEESLLLQQQLTIRKKGIFILGGRSREKAFVAENIEKKVKVP